MITKERVLESLKKVIDPELNVNIVDLGLIYNVEINQIVNQIGQKKGQIRRCQASPPLGWSRHNSSGQVNVTITMTLTTPGCPLSAFFDEYVRDAVKKIKGVKKVIINLVWEPAWNPDKMTDEAREAVGIIK